MARSTHHAAPAPHAEREIESELERGPVIFAQWSGVLGGPTVFLLGQGLLYAGVPGACRMGTGARAALHVGAAVTLLLAAAVVWVAWREWRRVGGGWPRDEGGPPARSRLLGIMGLLLAGFFMVLSLWQWVPLFVFSPCHGS